MSDFTERPSGLSYTNYNNRCIKAYLEETDCDAHLAMTSIITKLIPGYLREKAITEIVSLLMGYTFIKPSYMGKATLNIADGDTFDEEEGKRLAKERVLEKYHKDFDGKMIYALNMLRTFCAGVEHYCRKHNIDIDYVPTVSDIELKIYDSGRKARK